jgi:hypothetical protein
MVPFVKVSRDRRGYEHFLLVQHPPHGGKSGPRVLYWFRTPPNVKVGREPFDEGVRRALEVQNPDVVFDWERLRETPTPLAQPEYWRERRRAERAARRLHEVGRPTSDSADSDEDPAMSQARGEPPRESAEAVPQPRVGETAALRRHRRRRRRRNRRENEQGVAGGGQPSAPLTPPQPPTSGGEVLLQPLVEPEKTQ